MVFHSLCIKMFPWMSLTEPEAREISFVSIGLSKNLSHPVVWMVKMCTPQILCFLLFNRCIVAQKNITYDETEHRYSDHSITNYDISQIQSKKQYKTRKKGKKANKSKIHAKQNLKQNKTKQKQKTKQTKSKHPCQSITKPKWNKTRQDKKRQI